MRFDERPTKPEMEDLLRAAGLKKKYKPFAEDNGGVWSVLLECRSPARIVEGALVGSEVAVYAGSCFQVWTSKTVLSARLILEHGLNGHSRDGEVEVIVPGHLGDDILPRFGAKVRRQMSEEASRALSERGKRALESLRGGQNVLRKGISGT
jgi:hypothetical protein